MNGRTVDYDRVASTYDDRYRDNHYDGVARAILRFAGDSGLRVLEVGCGTGHWLSLLARGGVEVAGLDASNEMLERARARLSTAELVHGRAEALPWADASFDRVLCVNAFHHFRDHRAFVYEARRVLRPGGGLMISGLDPHAGSDRWWLYDAFDGALARDQARYPAASAIRAMMRAAGFDEPSTVEAQHVSLELEVRRALAEGRLDKSTTSQLVILTDEEYRAGIARLLERAGDAESRGEEAFVRVDLRLWATTAWAARPPLPR